MATPRALAWPACPHALVNRSVEPFDPRCRGTAGKVHRHVLDLEPWKNLICRLPFPTRLATNPQTRSRVEYEKIKPSYHGQARSRHSTAIATGMDARGAVMARGSYFRRHLAMLV